MKSKENSDIKNSGMDMVDNMPLAKKRAVSSEGVMETFPEGVIGIILSHMGSARNLVMASSTCHKWHKASIHHLQRLTFLESDFFANDAGMAWVVREIIITKAVMKTRCLRELSVSMNSRFELQPAAVIAWLLHTKKTLKSLTFKNRITPRINILESLGSKVEHLDWSFAYIPTVNPATRAFKSLVVLELANTYLLTAQNLKALLSVCPKLETLSLLWVSASPAELLELQSPSLKVLNICGGLNGTDRLVLHAESLESVTLSMLNLELFKLVQGSGNSALRYLFIDDTNIRQLDFGEAAKLLLDLEICGTNDLTAEWLKYYEVISSASLKKLKLLGLSVDIMNSIDICKIATSFPGLHFLALEYEHASQGFLSHDSGLFPIFEKLAVLELSCFLIRDGFAQWIGQFLERSPNLKRLKIYVDQCDDCRVASILSIVDLYPHVDVNFLRSHDENFPFN